MAISTEQIETLLIFGHLALVLDGLNEINEAAKNQGAIQDILNFVDTYPECQFVITSRYITIVSDIALPKIEMISWEQQQVEDFLVARLGQELGTEIFVSLGDNLDFKWMQGNSLAGLSCNPLTLWMIATNAEAEAETLGEDISLVNSLIKILVDRTPEPLRHRLPSKILVNFLEEFAYLMVEYGFILSLPYEIAIETISQVIDQAQLRQLGFQNLSAIDLLDSLMATGLIYRDGENLLC